MQNIILIILYTVLSKWTEKWFILSVSFNVRLMVSFQSKQ